MQNKEAAKMMKMNRYGVMMTSEKADERGLNLSMNEELTLISFLTVHTTQSKLSGTRMPEI